MKRSLVILSIVAAILAIGLSGAIRTPSGRLDLTQLLIPGASARFANLLRAGRAYSSGEHYHPDATLFGIRWFPTSVSFAADNDTVNAIKRSVDSNTYRSGLGMGLFLRGLSEGSQDEGGFDGGGCKTGRLNQFGTALAYVTAGGTHPAIKSAIAIIEEGRGLADTRLILNWPKLDLRATLPRHP